jgi:hypothetical protein
MSYQQPNQGYYAQPPPQGQYAQGPPPPQQVRPSSLHVGVESSSDVCRCTTSKARRRRRRRRRRTVDVWPRVWRRCVVVFCAARRASAAWTASTAAAKSAAEECASLLTASRRGSYGGCEMGDGDTRSLDFSYTFTCGISWSRLHKDGVGMELVVSFQSFDRSLEFSPLRILVLLRSERFPSWMGSRSASLRRANHDLASAESRE